jgi:hypothetical protein
MHFEKEGKEKVKPNGSPIYKHNPEHGHKHTHKEEEEEEEEEEKEKSCRFK